MHSRPMLLLAILASLLAVVPASAQTPKETQNASTTIPVGDADNKKSIIIHYGDDLSVALDANPTTGYSWNVLADPESPLSLSNQPQYTRFPHKRGIVGSGGYTTYEFHVRQPASYARSFYLRLLSLRPFDKGIASAKLWEIKVTIPASPAAK